MEVVVLHAEYPGVQSLSLLAVVTVAAAGTAVLLGLALAAFVQRRSGPYLLIVAALGALLARSGAAGLTLAGALSPAGHHFLEHGLDVLLVALVIAAVYYAQTVARDPDTDL